MIDEEIDHFIATSGERLACPACAVQSFFYRFRSTTCPSCERKWLRLSAELIGHQDWEIDDHFKDECLGVLTDIIFPAGMYFCGYCGELLSPGQCCSGSIDKAIEMLCYPKSNQGPETRTKAVKFLTDNLAALRSYVAEIKSSGTSIQKMRISHSGILGLFKRRL